MKKLRNTSMAKGLYYYANGRARVKVYICEHCGSAFTRRSKEVVYKHKGKVFCTWTCKCRYIRKCEEV